LPFAKNGVRLLEGRVTEMRSAEELWRRVVEEAGEDEIERAASVSVAQAEKELAEAGFDVAAERARGEALLDELEGVSRPASETSHPGPDPAATDLRSRAALAGNAGRATECLSLLDQARDIDPAGDSTPDIKRLRARASDQLQAKPR
jgi:hypothetical protein